MGIVKSILHYSKDILKIPKVFDTLGIRTAKNSSSKILQMRSELATDVFELQNNRWSKSLIDYKPRTYYKSSIKDHHEVNRYNVQVRKYLNDSKENDISNQEIEKVIKKIDDEFASLKPTDRDYVVYRGRVEHPIFKENNSDFVIIDRAKVGDVIVPDVAYSYAAHEKSLALVYGNAENSIGTMSNGKAPRGIMYTIRIPKGSQISISDDNGGEVLFPRRAQYKLVEKETNGNNINVILEYIMPSK